MNPHSLHTMLKESIERFLSNYRNNTTDFTDFSLIFSRVINNLHDPPPLDLLWFYSALNFHSSKPNPSLNPVSRTKDLFHLLLSFSSNNADQSIAAMAPVVAELFHLAVQRKELRNEVEALLEAVIVYFSISRAGEGCNNGGEGLGLCFEDLVRVWVVDRVGGGCKFSEVLKVFVPGVSDGVRDGIGCGGYGIGRLVGAVMCEVFLLRLCLKVEAGVSPTKLEKEMVACAAQMITAFRNFYFLDALLKMLLEPVLPVTCLLNIEGEDFLRCVLYSAVMTVDYSFLSCQEGNKLLSTYLKDLAMRWLFVADNAIRFVRETEDRNKFFSYVQAFSESLLPSQLIKWVTDHHGMQSLTSKPDALTPVSLIKWLLNVEDQGAKVFDCELSKIYAKAVICKSRAEFEPLVSKSDIWNLNGNQFSYSSGEEMEDNADGDLKMVDSVEGSLLAASGLVKLTASDNAKKRKEGRKYEGNKQCKFPKCQVNENLVRESFSPMDDENGMDGWSDRLNALFDGDVQLMEQ